MKHSTHAVQYKIHFLIFARISARQYGHAALIEGSSDLNMLIPGDPEEYWSIRYVASPTCLLVEISDRCD